MNKRIPFSGVPYFIARRYLFSKGDSRFASFLTVVSILGVTIGITALIIVISVMNGFSKDLKSKLMGFNPHVTVLGPSDQLPIVSEDIKNNFKDVENADLFTEGEIVIQTPLQNRALAVGGRVIGIKNIPQRMLDSAVFYSDHSMVGKESSDLKDYSNDDLNSGVILGSEMMYQLEVFPGIEDTVQLIAPFGDLDPLGNPTPLRREYVVAGGFRSGFYEYDNMYLFLKYNEAKKLLGMQSRDGVFVTLKNPNKAQHIAGKISKYLGDNFKVSAWSAKNKRLFAALKLEKIAMSFLLFLIIIIASFSIIGVAMMVFFSKRKDLAVLMSIGASRKNIKKIFLIHGGLIGFIGSLLGVIIGLVLCLLIKKTNIALPASYYLDYLPVSINGLIVFLVAFGGILISLVASYYPAKRASSMDPLQLLRYE